MIAVVFCGVKCRVETLFGCSTREGEQAQNAEVSAGGTASTSRSAWRFYRVVEVLPRRGGYTASWRFYRVVEVVPRRGDFTASWRLYRVVEVVPRRGGLKVRRLKKYQHKQEKLVLVIP